MAFGKGMREHPLYDKYESLILKVRNNISLELCERWSGEDGIYNFIDDVYSEYRKVQLENEGCSISLKHNNNFIDRHTVYFIPKGRSLGKVRYIDKNTGAVTILTSYKEVSDVFTMNGRGSSRTYATKKIANGETYKSKDFYLEPISN